MTCKGSEEVQQLIVLTNFMLTSCGRHGILNGTWSCCKPILALQCRAELLKLRPLAAALSCPPQSQLQALGHGRIRARISPCLHLFQVISESSLRLCSNRSRWYSLKRPGTASPPVARSCCRTLWSLGVLSAHVLWAHIGVPCACLDNVLYV